MADGNPEDLTGAGSSKATTVVTPPSTRMALGGFKGALLMTTTLTSSLPPGIFLSIIDDDQPKIFMLLVAKGPDLKVLIEVDLYVDLYFVQLNVSVPGRLFPVLVKQDLLLSVSVRHFSKSIRCMSHLAKPDCAFYGIAPQGACLKNLSVCIAGFPVLDPCSS
ncbi:hypothetical protein NC652_008128 [Populus alba x Populus x berolinensis]|nr:hypothetical protein NC652_008128 [Populus alba x Populus x berolinensis]